MREIKFRGWTIDTRREVKGYYCKVEGKHYIVPDDAEFAGIHFPMGITGFVEVSPETVGQYIGINDSKRTKEYPKGQEIYGSIPIDGKMSKGGDILLNDKDAISLPNERIAVKWLPGHFVAGGILGAGDHIGEDCEVIGNIHSDPKLLKD